MKQIDCQDSLRNSISKYSYSEEYGFESLGRREEMERKQLTPK